MRWGYLAFRSAWIELVGSHFCLHTGFDTILTDTSFVIPMWGKTFPATAHESAKCVKTHLWTTSVVDHAFVDICAGRKEKCPQLGVSKKIICATALTFWFQCYTDNWRHAIRKNKKMHFRCPFLVSMFSSLASSGNRAVHVINIIPPISINTNANSKLHLFVSF